MILTAIMVESPRQLSINHLFFLYPITGFRNCHIVYIGYFYSCQ